MFFKYACYFPAEEPLFFVVNISSEDWISEFSKAIQQELKLLSREVVLKDLRLYKTDISLEPEEDLQTRALQWLHQQPPNGHLKDKKKIRSFFPDGPSIIDDTLDVIIVDAEVLELVEGLGDPADVYNRRAKKCLDQCLNRLKPPFSPSEIVHSPDKVANLLGGDEPPIHLGRPGGVPAAIFNPALAIFHRKLEHLEQVEISRHDVERAAKYLQCVVMFYKDEAQRQKAITELVDEAIGEKGKWGRVLSWADNIKPDSCWWCYEFLILVLELKNTLGLSGDALLQAAVDYTKIIPQEKFKRFREYSNFPIVLVGATANRLEISIAVCVGSIYVSKLLMLDLSLGFHASDNIIRLARIFKALAHCRVDLRKYYDHVAKFLPPKLSCLYPSPTPVDTSKMLPKIVYKQPLSQTGQPASGLVDLGTTTTAIYVATLADTNQEVVVKFTARYNETAHRILADAQLAPRLHFCERVIGNLYMVVMDFVDGKSVWQLQVEETPVPAVVSKKVEDALNLLHAQDIVFADLRDPNILYVACKGSGEGCVILVDFDWPAKDGEGRYPAMLNPNNAWSDDVSPYGIMRKSHDLWQLSRLRALSNPVT